MTDIQDRATKQVLDVLTLVGESKSKMDTDKLLTVQNLSYVLQPQLSCVNFRRLERQPYTSNNYNAGEVMTIQLNSGERFMIPRNSYLQFQWYWNATNADDTHKVFASTIGAYACFQSSTVTTASGVELCRIDSYLNYLNSIRLLRRKNTHSREKLLAGVPSAGNTNYTYLPPANRAVTAAGGGAMTISAASSAAAPLFQIPLADLNPIFDTDQPLPHLIVSGLRIDLTLAPYQLAGVVSGTAATTYSIVNPAIISDNLYLTDAFLQALTKQAATGGLEMEFSAYANQAFAVASAAPQLQSQRALTHVKEVVVARFVTPNGTPATEAALDSFINGAADNLIVGYQFNVGSQYYPNHYCIGYGTSQAQKQEIFRLGVVIPGCIDEYADLTYDRWGGTTSYMSQDTPTCCNPLLICDLQRSPIMSHSGLGLSSAKNLTCNMTLSTSDTAMYIMLIRYSLGLEIFSDGRVIVRT